MDHIIEADIESGDHATKSYARSRMLADEHRRRQFVEAMILMRRVGDVRAVRRWLCNPDVIAQEQIDSEAAVQIAECREWFVSADAHEKVNGTGSLIDRTHPFWVNSLEPALRRVEQIQASKRTSAAFNPKM